MKNKDLFAVKNVAVRVLLIALLLRRILLDDDNLWFLLDDNYLWVRMVRMVWMRPYVRAVGRKKWICNPHAPVTPRKEKSEKDKKYHFLHVLLFWCFVESRGVADAVGKLHDDLFFHDGIYPIAENLVLHTLNPLFLLEFVAKYLSVLIKKREPRARTL